MSGRSLCHLLLLRGICTPLQQVNNGYVCPVRSIQVLPLMPSLKRCEGSTMNPIRALNCPEEVDLSEALPRYTPPTTGWIPIHRSPTPVLASQVIGRCLHQVREELMHMQRCRELFAVAMHRVDDLMYNPEGNRLLLREEEVTAELSSLEEGSGESEGDEEDAE